MIDLSNFALIGVVTTLVSVVIIILLMSDLSEQSIGATLRDYWRTFFGEISDHPVTPPSDSKPTPFNSSEPDAHSQLDDSHDHPMG